jgi:NOL1/NOP2/fmu family ribosome biogenesis protein
VLDGVPDALAGAELTTRGDRLLARSSVLPSLAGLGTLRDGLWLGTFRKDRFEPDHALALALPKGSLGRTLDLAPDDPRVTRYLQGHPLEAAGPSGWLAVTVSGFGLGWGKRSHGVINNGYPKGLRLR